MSYPARLLLFFLMFSGSGLAAPARRSSPHNIVLITLDTTRADRMGFLGSQRGLTPNLDALARDSVVFTHAYSQAPITSASHATILTGTYPQFHHVDDAGMALAKDIPYAPDILRRRGYHTAAFTGCVILDPKAGGAPGFDRGFGTYDAGFHARQSGESRYQSLERRGGEVVAHAIAWLDKHSAAPFFLWVHIYDPHAPYDPPEPFRSRYASQLYDGEIASADAAVGKLLDYLHARKLYDGTIIAAVADHGEAFGEHGERGHGIFLYDPTIHVPLLIKLPGQAGERIDSRVSLVDVLPTILQAVGDSGPTGIQGKSLLPLLAPGSKEAERAAYSEASYPQRAFGWSPLRSLRSGKYLFVEAPRSELYDQQTDPAAAYDLSSTAAPAAQTLKAQLDAFRGSTGRSAVSAAEVTGRQQEEQLRALGYVASSGAPKKDDANAADPKDKIEAANEMAESSLALEEGHYQEAIATLDKVVARDPTVSAAYSSLGAAWSAVGNLQRAIPALRKAVELRPGSVSAHYQLGMALFTAGDLRAAAPQFEAAVAGDPQSADMRFSLASIYVRLDRTAEAKQQLETALKLKPADYDSNLMLGQILLNEKKPAAALPYLQGAASVQPRSPRAHQFLADAYAQLGRKEQAAREHMLAERFGKQ